MGHIQSILRQLLQAVHYLHSSRFLHRDIKPLNILLTAKGQVKLADFGLSRICNASPRNLTREVATLWYRPPEVMLGEKNYAF